MSANPPSLAQAKRILQLVKRGVYGGAFRLQAGKLLDGGVVGRYQAGKGKPYTSAKAKAKLKKAIKRQKAKDKKKKKKYARTLKGSYKPKKKASGKLKRVVLSAHKAAYVVRGHEYTYTIGNTESRRRAKAKALGQRTLAGSYKPKKKRRAKKGKKGSGTVPG